METSSIPVESPLPQLPNGQPINLAMAAAAAAVADEPSVGHLPRSPNERRCEEDESEEEEEVESGDEEEEDDDGSEVASLADLCDPDGGSDEDPTFDPDADGYLEVEAVLRSRMSRMSISASARKGRKGLAVSEMGKEEVDLLAMVDKLIQDGQLEKLKVYECKSYLRMHKLRLTGKKEVLLNRIREHIEVKNAGEVKYPVSSFVLNCKGDACKGDVVMFEQNIYRRKKGAPREVKRLCGQRTNAGRIIKESYGTAKQQHTFTIEILWSKGYRPWPPLHPLLIKGRNLYKDKTMRQPWTDEEERKRVLQEKHARGFVARKSRALRIQEKEIEKIMRTDERKCPSIQNGAHGNTSQQHVHLKATPTQHDAVLSHKGGIRILKQEFINHQVPSNHQGGLQQQMFPQPTHMKQMFIESHQHPKCESQNEVRQLEGVLMTFRNECIDRQATSQHSEVLPPKGATRTFKQELTNHQVPFIQQVGLQRQMHPQPTHTLQLFKDSQQQPTYQSQNEVRQQEGGTVMASRKECMDRQAPSQHYGESGNPRQYQISSKLTPSQQTLTPKYQDCNHVFQQDDVRSHRKEVFNYQNNSNRATEYDEGAYQPRGNFTQHTKAYQRGSNYHENGPADHQGYQPHRSRNWNFNSKDQYYDQDCNRQYNHGCRGRTPEQHHPQKNWHQNNFNRRNMTQDQYQYHTRQNQYQNHGYHSRMNQKQYHHQQKQSQKLTVQPPELEPCNFFYRNGWCRFGKNCWYSHDF